MQEAGIKEIKNNLSRYLAKVKMGEEILITERGKPIARIIKESDRNTSIRNALASLIQKGLIVMPSQSMNKAKPPQVKASGQPASGMVIEDRRRFYIWIQARLSKGIFKKLSVKKSRPSGCNQKRLYLPRWRTRRQWRPYFVKQKNQTLRIALSKKLYPLFNGTGDRLFRLK